MINLPTLPEPDKYNHSASAIKEFMICEYRYGYYKNFVPWTDSDDSLRGKQIHDCLEWLGDRQFDEAMIDLAVEAYSNNNDDYADSPLDEDTLRSWIMNAWPGVCQLKPTKSEFWVRQAIPGCKHPLVGRVDCLSATLPDGTERECLVDYKSTKNMGKVFSSSEVKQSIQGLCYSWATGVRDVAFIFFSQYHEAVIVHHEYTEKELEQGKHFLTSTCQAIEKRWKDGAWRLCQTGGLCSPKWCEAYKDCYGAISLPGRGN